MPGRGPQTFKKRQKEQQRKERQQEKMAKRLARKDGPPSSADDQNDIENPFLQDGETLDSETVVTPAEHLPESTS